MDYLERVDAYEREKADALAQEAMGQAEYMGEAVFQYASAYGSLDPDSEYVLSPFDTWERNPHYRGPRGPHPEDDSFWDMSEAEQAAYIAALNAPPAPVDPAPDLDPDCPF